MYVFKPFQVCMDRNSPAEYVQDAATNLEETRQFLAALSGPGLVQPVITPRFVPSCTPQLLKGAHRTLHLFCVRFTLLWLVHKHSALPRRSICCALKALPAEIETHTFLIVPEPCFRMQFATFDTPHTVCLHTSDYVSCHL